MYMNVLKLVARYLCKLRSLERSSEFGSHHAYESRLSSALLFQRNFVNIILSDKFQMSAPFGVHGIAFG